MAKTIVTAALTGVLATRKQSEYIPYTAQEIAEDGKRAVDAGASILHIHARNDDGSPAYDIESYRKIDEAVKSLCGDVIINYSTGAIGIDRETRIHHCDALKPDMAALNMGSMNYAIYSPKHKKFYHDHVFENPFKDIGFFMERMKASGTRPEMECFDVGHINNVKPMLDLGLIEAPLQFSFIMGVLGGIPATTENLVHQSHQVPQGSHWQVIGIGRKQWRMIGAAISLGGNIRVGLEDNLYMPDGSIAKGNGACVEAGVNLVHLMGGQVASIAEARGILQIPVKQLA